MPRNKFLQGGILISLFCIILTSCSSPDGFDSSANILEEQVIESIGTGGRLISIQSDNVRAAGYNASSMIMTVQFNNG